MQLHSLVKKTHQHHQLPNHKFRELTDALHQNVQRSIQKAIDSLNATSALDKYNVIIVICLSAVAATQWNKENTWISKNRFSCLNNSILELPINSIRYKSTMCVHNAQPVGIVFNEYLMHQNLNRNSEFAAIVVTSIMYLWLPTSTIKLYQYQHHSVWN